MTTFADSPGDGAIPGEYTVTVQKTAGADEGVVGDAEESDVSEEEEAAPEDLLPATYADKTTSGLTATVPEGGKDFVFELED
jgi:hypothetical protein